MTPLQRKAGELIRLVQSKAKGSLIHRANNILTAAKVAADLGDKEEYKAAETKALQLISRGYVVNSSPMKRRPGRYGEAEELIDRYLEQETDPKFKDQLFKGKPSKKDTIKDIPHRDNNINVSQDITWRSSSKAPY